MCALQSITVQGDVLPAMNSEVSLSPYGGNYYTFLHDCGGVASAQTELNPDMGKWT